MTSYFPDQESLVTVLRYRVVIDEIVVEAAKLAEYNKRAATDDIISPEEILETEDNKFRDWEWGSPSSMASPSNFVGEMGEGYVAFEGDVTSGSDDLFPGHYDSWAHSWSEPIPFACNDYHKLLGISDD
tara:strand:- start:453 stop:839 length:387 start_codon:yes stop_codon:yes gene_type:complete